MTPISQFFFSKFSPISVDKRWEQNLTSAKTTASAIASNVSIAPPSSDIYIDSFSTGYSQAITDSIVFAVTSGGSFSGSAVEMKTSIPGRSERPLGLEGDGVSNFSFKAWRSVDRFTGLSLGRMSRTHENANQSSQIMEMTHSQIASLFGFWIRHPRKKKRIARRITISTLRLRPRLVG